MAILAISFVGNIYQPCKLLFSVNIGLNKDFFAVALILDLDLIIGLTTK